MIYNSGAIWWSSIENTPMKRFRLMQSINPEGLYGIVQEVLAKWKAETQTEGRIVVISPPIYSRFVKGKTAYASKSDSHSCAIRKAVVNSCTVGKYGMSVLTMGLAVDFEREGKTGMAITSLWPAAVRKNPIALSDLHSGANMLYPGHRLRSHTEQPRRRSPKCSAQARNLLRCHPGHHPRAAQRRQR